MLGVVERELGGGDDGLEADDGGVGVDESGSLLDDGVELSSSKGGGEGSSRVLKDCLDLGGVAGDSVVLDEESGDPGDEGSLREENRGE